MARIGQITRLRTGTASLAGTATLNAAPPVVIADTWTKLSAGFTAGDTRAGPDLGSQGWNKVGINTSNGELFAVQGSPTTANYGVFLFSPTTGQWRRTNTITNDWRRGPVNTGGFAFFENFDCVYDPVRNGFWQDAGGPVPHPPGSQAYDQYVWHGERFYSIANDSFYNYWPKPGNNYVPVAADVGYFNVGGVKNATIGFDSCLVHWNDYNYYFNSWSSSGTDQNLFRRNLTSGAKAQLTATNPPWTTEPARLGQHRCGMNYKYKYLWTLADNMAFYIWDEGKRVFNNTATSWALQTTTNKPIIPNPTGKTGYPYNDYGVHAVIDEDANCMVAWVGQNQIVNGDGGSDIRATYIMDLATRVWRAGPSLAGGHTVPPAQYSVGNSLMYDRANKRTVLAVSKNGITEVWALQIAQQGGKITSFALPTSSGSTYGTNFYGFPYTTNGSSKHTNMCYGPTTNRLYVSGGDSITSATNGIWSMDLDDGSWRLEEGNPIFPSIPAPNGMQDGALFAWMPSRSKMLFGFGGYFNYVGPNEYAKGIWYFDPATQSWTQDLSLFNTGPPSSGSGNVFGGVYDSSTDRVYTILDSTNANGPACRRWDISTVSSLSSVSISQASMGTAPSGQPQALFGYGQQVQLGRYIYCPGFWSDGNTGALSGKTAALWRYNIDTGVFNEVLPRPPNFSQAPAPIECRLGVSNNKIVWPRIYGPEGTLPQGLMIYDPALGTWTNDTKTPAYGQWQANAVATIPPCSKFPVGAVAMSGGVFGPQQTHIWFYEAA